ncbi:MAG: DUF1343 domain-containing protein [Elusimicrobia bacterium]|jgi:uncharacterized protein YbbC (DUF1343 family)|nr:DUF1343 domain-containing protein [Elusimicrobiota bacterium]
MRYGWAFLSLMFFGLGSVNGAVQTGLDVLVENHFEPLWGKRVGVIANHAAVDRHGRHLVDYLMEAPGVTMAAVFSPEHGFSGTVEHGRTVNHSLWADTTIPLYSLYGDSKRPTADQLKNLDVLVCDLPDVGVRYYTYITTLGYALEEAAKADLEFVVLDRPNPLGGAVVEGLVLSTGVRHFTAYYSIPTRHGLTLGEIARWHDQKGALNSRLLTVTMRGWERPMLWENTGLKFIPPSPNIPTPRTALLYAGVGAFESTNVSVGRGTDTPFEVFGAPWMKNVTVVKRLSKKKLRGVRFKAVVFRPKTDRYKKRKCYGVRVIITNPKTVRPVDIFVHAVCALRDISPKDFKPRWAEMPRVVGSSDFEVWFNAGESPETILNRVHESAAGFSEERKPFLLYP